MTATLTMRRALQRKLRQYAGLVPLAGNLQRMRAEVWRWEEDHKCWRGLGCYSSAKIVGDGPWRVRLEIWQGKTEYGRYLGKVCHWPDCNRRPQHGGNHDHRGREERGRRYVTALGEALELHDAIAEALVLLDEQLEQGWYAVKLEPSALALVNRMLEHAQRVQTIRVGREGFGSAFGHLIGRPVTPQLLEHVHDTARREILRRVPEAYIEGIDVEVNGSALEVVVRYT